MISDDLSAIADRLRPAARGTMRLTLEGAAHLIHQLEDLAEQARELERATVPAAARMREPLLPPDVPSLDQIRRMRAAARGGGDAA